MNATEHDIDILLKLQEVDRRVASAQKEFDALPHRKAILEVRAKRDEVFKKKVQVRIFSTMPRDVWRRSSRKTSSSARSRMR